MLVLGLGGAMFPISKLANLSGTALSAIVGIVLNLVFKDKEETENSK